MIQKLNEYRKAIAAFLVPALTVLGAALLDGVVTPQEWITIAIAALTSSAIVAAVPNEPPFKAPYTDEQAAKHLL